jgi:glutamate synthase (ferredoxin)
VAERLLGDWDASLERFVKVMPDDYRRVLDEQAALAGELAEVS